MSYQQFIVSDRNPNDDTGGGGCVCDPSKQMDCKGPYVICYGNEMLDPLSPHVVVSESCVKAMARALKQDEKLSVGRPGSVVQLQLPELSEPQVLDRDRDVMEQRPRVAAELEDFDI